MNSWVEDDPLAEPHQGGGSGPWQVNESFPELPDWNPRDGDFTMSRRPMLCWIKDDLNVVYTLW